MEEFNGTSIDASRWTVARGWKVNNVITRKRNVSVADGVAKLQLSKNSNGVVTGAMIHTYPYGRRYNLPVGSVVEARVRFPGSSKQHWFNWPAWWVSGPNWPKAGEHDIAEGLGGDPTVNYHSPSGAHNQGRMSGVWRNAFHIYTLHRKAKRADVYWDGKLARSYPTDDNGKPHRVILNVGRFPKRTPVLGNAGAVRIDWVRAWARDQ